MTATTLPLREVQRLGKRWIRACVLGELVGFIPPALTGALLVWLDSPEAVLVTGLVVAGVAEGAILGEAQSRVMRVGLPAVTGWATATAIAAGIAWLAGMGGSALIQAVGNAALWLVVPAAGVGLLAMGLFQWWRLRPVVNNAVSWIPATTAAWLAGVMIPVAALSIVPNSWHLAAHVVVGVAAAVAMGAVVGAVTAIPFKRFVREARSD
ncbi:MAG: hypothetical protein WBM90_13285 [Acidimicrobiia bacterium]